MVSSPDNSESQQPIRFTDRGIKTDLNDLFMTGLMSGDEFLSIMLAAATQSDTKHTALTALKIALGDLTASSMVAKGITYDIIRSGPDNERTQSVVAALKPEHLKILRELMVKTPFALDPYLLSLSHAPRVAMSDDMEKLREFFDGLPVFGTTEINPDRRNYHPKDILDVIKTMTSVVINRPDLIDSATTQAVGQLPQRITKGNFYIRPSFDRGISKEQVVGAAQVLQASLRTN